MIGEKTLSPEAISRAQAEYVAQMDVGGAEAGAEAEDAVEEGKRYRQTEHGRREMY